MRVLFLYPYAPGTVSSFVRPANIIRCLLQSGIDVTLATVRHFRQAPTDISLSLREFSCLRKVPNLRLFAKKGAIFRNASIVSRLLKSHDLVHFQKCHPTVSLPAVIASILNRKPVHYDWDDNEAEILRSAVPAEWQGCSQLGEFRLIERRLVQLVDTVSVASSRLWSLAEQYGASRENVFDAPVGADLSLFAPRELSREALKSLGVRRPMVLYQGQLEQASFAEEFIECAVKVKDRIPYAQFMVVGGGAKLRELRELAKRRGAPIDFTGYIPHWQVAEYVNAADVCTATFPDNELTRCKSPLKIVEYMASGKAIVATGIGDVARMVSDAGILVAPNDTEGFADSIASLLEDSQLRAKLGAMARERAEREFNWERTTSNIVAAYKKALLGQGK